MNTHEGLLFEHLKAIFPGEHIYTNAKKLLNVKYPSSDAYMQFDIWVPKYNLCFEFQDSYHYETTWYHHNTRAFITHKDTVKSTMARTTGVSLIPVTCWWSGDKPSLVATIHFQRPDIEDICYGEEPISLNPQPTFFKDTSIPGVGELMLASLPPISGGPISESWWLGEKYDGIRCCWNASLNKIYLRNGRLLLLPKYTPLLPSLSTDMELWFGRGQYSYAYQLLTGADPTEMLRMMVFDTVEEKHLHQPFEFRYSIALNNIALTHPFAVVAPRMLRESEHSTASTKLLLDLTIADGGEGLICRKISSRYERGRSLSLLKLKNSLGDREGIVVGMGKQKSVIIKLPNGNTITVPPHNVHILCPPAPGDIVSFTYEVNSRHHIPASPVITRIRSDLTWDDVLLSFYTEHRPEASGRLVHPLGFWTRDNMRIFLESFAKSRNMDPLSPETWYSSFSNLRNSKGGRAIIIKFKGYARAVQSLFPEISFNQEYFRRVFWGNLENRRKFFEKYAKQNGFDPLLPSNWYMQFKEDILSVKGANRVISYHGNSITKALLDLFPNIGLSRRLLLTRPSSLWRNTTNHRLFFEKYARDQGFDPLLPLGWYKQSKRSILSAKNAHKVLQYYHNNVSKALLHVFPDIGLVQRKLFSLHSWHSTQIRRQFIEKFMFQHGKNLLLPDHWYDPEFYHGFLHAKGAHRILAFHRNSLSRALVDLFPDISFDITRLQRCAKNAP